MANFDINKYIIAREKLARHGIRLISYSAGRVPRTTKILKIVRCPGHYQIRR